MQDPRWYAPPAEAGPQSAMRDAQHEAVMLEPGRFWIRAGAHLVDIIANSLVALVTGAVGGVTVAILAGAGIAAADWQQRIGKTSPLTFVCSIFASLVYHSLAEGLGGATAGKAICGLRVLTDRNEPCTLPKAIGRNLAYYIDALFFGLVGWSAMSKSPMQQRLGDQWAGTVVVHARSAQGVLTRSPLLGILVAFAAYGTIQFLAIVLRCL